IPLVGLWGKELNIENQSIHRGIVRTAKDAMRLYNYNRSMGAEHLALAPKAPWLVTPTMIGAFKQQWDTADKRNWPYLFFEP
ncbi:MAG: hypothetical protein GWN94_20085, partial [Phycisphaerae bacterium]|nr:hypothetical protein [Phycisphaerae bacterium]NIS53371.1 hypothetical protein [Phycisphaerae bacterium]NIX30305.1 hypothetical protein [Phycisphaerae bacterium]